MTANEERDGYPERIELSPVHTAFLESEYRIVAMYGGSGSGKTFAVLNYMLYRLLDDSRPFRGAIVRKHLTSLKTSTLEDWKRVVSLHDAWGLIRENKTELTYRHGKNWIKMLPAADENRITGADFNLWFIEEAFEIPESFYDQVRNRSGRSKYGESGKIILAWNPVSDQSWLYKRFIQNTEPDSVVIRSTYKNNPHLSESYVKDLEGSKERNPHWYRIYALGEWGTAEGLVYDRNMWRVDDTVEFAGYDCFGVDWGFENATVVVGIKRLARSRIEDRLAEAEGHRPTFVVDQLLYAVNWSSADFLGWLHKVGIDLGMKNAPIYCDTTWEGTIAEMVRKGYNARNAEKSVHEGIQYVQSCYLIFTGRSTETVREIENYAWAVDTNGNTKDEPVKYHDHAMDAMRYALYSHYRRTTLAPKPKFIGH